VGIAGAGVDAWSVGTEVFAGFGGCEVPADEPTRVGAPFGEVEGHQRGPTGSRHCEDAPVGAEGLGRWAGACSDECVTDRLAAGDVDQLDRGVNISDRE
jgi:hypothetical protein